MSRESWGKITEYSPSMAAKMAEMFNAFNEIWPAGFGGGVPYDEQRVRDMLDSTSAIADLVALDPDGTPVGYCGLYPHQRDFDAAYISLLGVHPRVLGKKFGKKLLLKALEIAAEKGIQRVDLGTWPGNLKAVPLYKKVGLFWVPDTSVYMQDYLPGLLQIPLAKEWFSHHPDWYTCFKRELTQAPDKYVVDGMDVYTYTFEAGDDTLCAHVDRYGWKFSCIERVLNNKKIGVKTRLHSHDIFIGVPNALTIEIVNETGEDLSVTLQVEPFKGLQWKESFPFSLIVHHGEPVTITREFVVDRNAPVFESNEVASEVIKSRITVKDQPIELYTGGKIRPAVTISSQELYKIVPPGRETKVYLDVINNTEKELTGKVDIFLEGVTNSHKTLDVALLPHEVSGIEIPVYTADATTIYATPSIKIGDTHFLMPTYQHTAVADCKDLSVVVEGGDKKELVILTDFLRVHIERERGRIDVSPRTLDTEGEKIDFDVGPPFGLSLDRSLQFDYEIIKEGRYCTVVLTGDSIHVPGVQIKKYIKVAPGMHEIEHWVTLTNLNPDGPLHVAGRVITGAGEGININLFSAKKRVFTPVNKTIIESDPSTNIMSETMVPKEPEYWEESWTAAQNLNKSDFSGWIWKPENIEKIHVFSGSLFKLESITKVVNPGEVYEPTHIWYAFSHSSLNEIRGRWNQLVGKKEILPAEHYSKLSTTPPVTVELAGKYVIEKGKKSKKMLQIWFATAYPFPGELQLILPPGWEGHFITEKGNNKKILMPEPVPGEAASIEVELSVPDSANAVELVQLHFSGEFELDFDIPLIVIGKKNVKIESKDIDGHTVMEVSNGVLTFDVVTEVGGNMIRLQDAQGRTFFADNYPTVKPKLFVEYNIGGVQSTIFVPDQDNIFFEPEKVAAEIVEDNPWRGVRVSWTIENQELLRGQNYALQWLTAPDSPVIRVRLEHENPVNRRVKWIGLLFTDLELQKSADDTILTVPGGMQTWVRNRVKKPFISLANLDNSWMRASKGDQSLTVLVPEGFLGTTMVLDLLEIILGLMMTRGEAGPKEKTAVEFVFVVNQPEEKVGELRKALAKR